MREKAEEEFTKLTKTWPSHASLEFNADSWKVGTQVMAGLYQS